MSVKVGKYTYSKSTRKDKKLMTVIDNKSIHFGDINADHYFDNTGLLPKSMNHLDKDRRDKYIKRHSAIKLKDGSRAVDDPGQPAYHALKILW